MKHPRMRLIRSCPQCRHLDVRRSHRKGLFESLFLPLLLIRPYRCNECQSRHMNFIFCKKVSVSTNQVDDAE
jgi:hypothetical protein